MESDQGQRGTFGGQIVPRAHACGGRRCGSSNLSVENSHLSGTTSLTVLCDKIISCFVALPLIMISPNNAENEQVALRHALLPFFPRFHT